MREGVALIDQSSFAKFEMIGPGAFDLLQRLAACNMDRPAGSVIYAQLCNERGGIEADSDHQPPGQGPFLHRHRLRFRHPRYRLDPPAYAEGRNRYS